MEVGDKFHVPATLPTGMTPYPLHRTLVGSREGLDMCGKTSPQTVRSLGRPDYGKSQSRPRYPRPQ